MWQSGATLKTACGSPCYAAPEMIAGRRYHGTQVDIWSSGIILYAMLCGYLPFEDPNTSQLYKKILKGAYEIPNYISGDCRNFLATVLNTDPLQRTTIGQIRQHAWFTMVGDKSDTNKGIIVGKDFIHIESPILEKLAELDFEIEHAQKCIKNNRHNHLTTTYYLIQKRLDIKRVIAPTFAPNRAKTKSQSMTPNANLILQNQL
jgi:5'-AMP-activated protein kinase catalytic alpha subunit